MFLKVLKGIWTYLSMALILVFFVGVASIFKTTLNLKLDEQMNKNNTRIERTFNIGSIKCSIDMTYYGVIKDTSGIGDLKKNFPPIDPAILGVTEDKRMYMIVYWDLDKDVERIVKNINNFKKYKLGKV